MSKADKLLNALGWEFVEGNNRFCSYHKNKIGIGINLIFTHYNRAYICCDDNRKSTPISKELHLAIHEKLKELGWYETY